MYLKSPQNHREKLHENLTGQLKKLRIFKTESLWDF